MALRISTGLANYIARTGSLKAGITNGYLFIFSGAQPADADAAATGTLLATISVGGAADAGLTIEDGGGTGDVRKPSGESWQGDGAVAGVAGWFRFKFEETNQATSETNAKALSTTDRRIDGSIAASGAQLNMSNTSVAVGAPQVVSTFTITLPQTP